ncbi:Bardet-Biedl syndrome 10 protein-like [Octopus vulgaris]|uniref:Bardet-Biedl syndrome 10 protein-like n=1 Tax=Octopus vulgaris TaxID=6645 RepID=A0AA36FLP4_OCTVU|nr:Bardet-Biedl syndrome 10 protein-like [Octopus vulgaris]
MAAINSSDISLSDIVRIVSSLSDICASSIGPMCEKTLFTTSTGSVQFVTNGIDILNALQFSHPVAKFVVNSLQHVHSVTGDGSKLFILYITELTRSIELRVNSSSQTNGTQFRENMRRISQGLRNFKRLIMEFEFRNRLSFLSSINSSDFLLSCCHLKQVCKSVLLSSLSDKESVYFSSLLIDFLSYGVECTDSLHQVIDFTIKHFDVLIHKDIGHCYSSSKVLPGILIPCEGPLSLDLSSSKEEIVSVILQNFLTSDEDAETTEATFKITESYEFSSLVAFQYHQCEAFIKQCTLNNVKLVCCCHEIPKFAETLFQQHGIYTISYLPEEFCEFFQTVTKKQPLSCIRDSLCDSSLVSFGLHKRIVINGSTYLQMTLLSCPLLVNASSSLILTAPTLGMVHSLSQQIFKCLKSLRMCFETFQILPFDHENITNENLTVTAPTLSSNIFTIPAMTFQTKMLQYSQERTFKNIAHNNDDDDDGDIPWEILHDTFRSVCRKVCTSQKFCPIQIQNCLPEPDEIKMNNNNSEEFYKEGSWLPLYTEFYILHSSLQVVIQLLNMDQIVKVKSIKKNV